MKIPNLTDSNYIVYADESGDHSLASIDEGYPIFVLSFCIFSKEYYAHTVTPSLRMLKFHTFGHDMVILHEHDISKKSGPFKLLGKEKREAFLEKMNVLIAKTEFTLIPAVIDKHKLKKQEIKDSNAYHFATRICLEKLYHFLQEHEQENYLTYIICEARGSKEDQALELEFRRICDGYNSFQKTLPFRIITADKKTNSEGLQFADMVARPIGLSAFRPGQPNRAVKILEKKLFKKPEGIEHRPYIYPIESEKPQGSP